jgi:hypothetical protein
LESRSTQNSSAAIVSANKLRSKPEGTRYRKVLQGTARYVPLARAIVPFAPLVTTSTEVQHAIIAVRACGSAPAAFRPQRGPQRSVSPPTWSAANRFGSGRAFNRLRAELHHGVDIPLNERVVLSLSKYKAANKPSNQWGRHWERQCKAVAIFKTESPTACRDHPVFRPGRVLMHESSSQNVTCSSIYACKF